MSRMVVDANYLQNDELYYYLSKSRKNKVVVTPYVELEMLKGNALLNVLKSSELLAQYPRQVVLTKDPHSINRLKGRKKGMKKRLTGGRRTSIFRKWTRHTRERARCGNERSVGHVMRQAAAARAQLADMRNDAMTFQQNIEAVKKRYTKSELDAFRESKFTKELIEKVRAHTMEMTQQFLEQLPGTQWPPKDDVFYTYIFRFALCARLHALYVIANGVAKAPENLPNDFIDVSVAAYATCFDGLLSKDKMTQDIYGKARLLLDEEFLTVTH